MMLIFLFHGRFEYIADYEYLLYCDLDEDEDYFHERDRHIFLEWPGKAKKSQTFENADKASLFRFWLKNAELQPVHEFRIRPYFEQLYGENYKTFSH